MNVIRYPNPEQWDELLKRPVMQVETLRETVCTVLDRVRAEGDQAVLDYELQFDHVALSSLEVSAGEWAEAELLVSDELKESLRLAHANIHKFHASQQFTGQPVEVVPGVTCW